MIQSIHEALVSKRHGTCGPTRAVHRRSSSSSSDLSDSATVVNMEAGLPSSRMRPADPVADNDTEINIAGHVRFIGTLKTKDPIRPRSSSQKLSHLPQTSQQNGWVTFEKPPSHRRCMSWSAPGSAPSYYPSAVHGRRFWRHCVVCQTLFNHNRLDAAKWKSKELVEGSSGRSVPSGLCDACIGSDVSLSAHYDQPHPPPSPGRQNAVVHMGSSRAELLSYISRLRKGLSASDTGAPSTTAAATVTGKPRSWHRRGLSL